jgi:hypothetical protein
MKRLISAFAVAATALVVVAPTTGARADDGGRVAAGIAGGVLGGMLLGGALAPRPVYPPDGPPPPPYGDPPPGYVDYGPGGPPPPQHCYWTRGQAVWDDAYGVWRRPRVQVCD